MQLSIKDWGTFLIVMAVVLCVWLGFRFDRSDQPARKKARTHILYGILLLVLVFVAKFTTRYYIDNYRDAPVKISSQERVSGKEILVAPKEISLAEVQAAQPVTSCKGQNEGTVCTVSGRSDGAGRCSMNDDSVFGCYITSSAK